MSDKPTDSVPPEHTSPSLRRKVDDDRSPTTRLSDKNPWFGAWKVSAVVAVVGLVGAGAGYSSDPTRFAFSYLFAFQVTLSLALGAAFFVLVQHLTSAGWSVTVRRSAEFLASGLMIMAVLFAPVWLMKDKLYPWWDQVSTQAPSAEKGSSAHEHHQPPHEEGLPSGKTTQHGPTAHDSTAQGGEGSHARPHANQDRAVAQGREEAREVEEHHLMHKKMWWLDQAKFNMRAVIYLVVWFVLGYFLLKISTDQDRTKDPKATLKLKSLAPPFTILFALSLTFAGFDWIMSLEPMWFSTIFGVYLFAGSVVSSLAAIILLTMGLRRTGVLQKEISTEHYHDLGKLMFGFNVFWAYIGFSQMMLIWYAALPEETPFYHLRWYSDEVSHTENGWMHVSVALIFFHFVAPFLFLISRNVKRRLDVLPWGAGLLLLMHAVDVYWLVLPNLGARYELGGLWIDVTCLVALLGAYGSFVFYRMKDLPLIPLGDPRLPRALHFENA